MNSSGKPPVLALAAALFADDVRAWWTRGVVVVTFLLLACPSRAAASEPAPARGLGSYQVILDRNPFRLRPSPTPSPASHAPAAVAAELKLTGVSSLNGQARAFLVREERGRSARYFNLAEGQFEDGMEVLSVDVREGVVRVRDAGTLYALSFTAQTRAELAARQEEEQFNEQHVRDHELREQQERERAEREEMTSKRASNKDPILGDTPAANP